MSPPTSGANPRGPTYAGRASPRPSPPLPLESKSGSVRQRIAATTHHGGDEIAAQPRPRYFKMAPPALIRRNQRTSSVPVAGRTASYARPPPQRASIRKPSISAGVRASSSMSVDHAPWSSEMPSGRGWKPGSRRGQPRCPRRPSAGPAPLRWDMNYPPTNKSRCSTPIHAIGLSTTTARASALVPDPYRVGAACPQRVRWSQCGQSADRH